MLILVIFVIAVQFFVLFLIKKYSYIIYFRQNKENPSCRDANLKKRWILIFNLYYYFYKN